MLNNFNNDILLKIFKLFHRFNYLQNLYYVNKYCNEITICIYNFHINKFNKYFNNDDNSNKNYLYLYISKKLYFNKILNLKKINKHFYKSISFNIPIFVKYFLVFDEYFDNLFCNKNVILMNNKQILNKLVDDYTTFYTFIKIYIDKKFSIHVQFNNNDNYRLKLTNTTINVCLYQSITKKNIVDLLKKNNINVYKHFLL